MFSYATLSLSPINCHYLLVWRLQNSCRIKDVNVAGFISTSSGSALSIIEIYTNDPSTGALMISSRNDIYLPLYYLKLQLELYVLLKLSNTPIAKHYLIKGHGNPMTSLFYKKELHKPWNLITVSSKSVEN